MAQRPSEVMTSEEVAALLQLSIRTIKRLVDDGHLISRPLLIQRQK